MMPLLGVSEIMDISPWRGWEICNNGTDARLGPIESPIGSIVIVLASAQLQIWKGEVLLLRSNIVGRLSHIRWRDGRIDLEVPGSLAADAFLQFPTIRADRVEGCRYGGDPVEPQRSSDGELTIVNLPRLAQRQIISLFFQ